MRLGLVGWLCVFAIMACAHARDGQPVAVDQTGNFFYEYVLRLYSGPLNHLEAVRHGQCPMYPSCSEYSRQAVARYGFVKGWVLTMDRLMRCGRDELRLTQKIRINGQIKYFDPIENNIL